MEIKTYLKNLKISPKKLRSILPEIKRLGPSKSLAYLFYLPNKSAKIFYKAIKSAIDNAKNVLKTNEDMLKFKLLTVEEGHKLKRYRPGGRGTMKPFSRKFSHINIILELRPESISSKQKKERIKVNKTDKADRTQNKAKTKILNQ